MVMRVNSINVQDEVLRIGGIGRRMNSKVKISQTRRISRTNMVINLAYPQSLPDWSLLAPIYRWPGLKEPVGSDTYYNVCIRHGLIQQILVVANCIQILVVANCIQICGNKGSN
jgi:hypothetical protein